LLNAPSAVPILDRHMNDMGDTGDKGLSIPLDGRARAILDLERGWWLEDGDKRSVIRHRLGCSTSRYYRLLDRLIDSPEALAFDPLLVKRLRRRRSARRRRRLAGAQEANT
jgi:hypothetical protein